MRLGPLLLLGIASISTAAHSADPSPVDWVNTFIGTGSFMQRSRSYKNLFNPARGFMQARNSDGSWASPTAGWTEGDEWVYLFAPLHDIPGVLKLLGGAAAFNSRLDQHFGGHHNHHDNEPSHHYSYLYDFGWMPQT